MAAVGMRYCLKAMCKNVEMCSNCIPYLVAIESFEDEQLDTTVLKHIL